MLTLITLTILVDMREFKSIIALIAPILLITVIDMSEYTGKSKLTLIAPIFRKLTLIVLIFLRTVMT